MCPTRHEALAIDIFERIRALLCLQLGIGHISALDTLRGIYLGICPHDIIVLRGCIGGPNTLPDISKGLAELAEGA